MEPPVCKFTGRCTSVLDRMKNVAFAFGNEWQYNPAIRDLFIEVNVNKIDYCQLLISTKEDRSINQIILGSPFLKSFITILDFKGK
jgi:hypothetical protein